MFSSRTCWDFSENKLTAKLAGLRARGVEVLDLTQSNPTACAIEYPPGLLEPLSDARNLCYRPCPLGIPSARRAIASCYAKQGIKVSFQNIVLVASTSEAYSFVLRLLADPGDHVLFPRPSYPLLDHLARINDVTVDQYFLRYDGAWRVDMDHLEQSIRPKTRAIVLVHPNNPTGSFLKKDEWRRLIRVCAPKGIALISDEVFIDYGYAPAKERMTSLARDSEVLTFALGGISKMLCLPQMKLAWICVNGPERLRRQAMQKLEMIADTHLSVNTPVQNALSPWLKFKKEIADSILRRVLSNRRRLLSQPWKDCGCEVLAAEGGWYAILRVPAIKSEEEWALEILAKKHVLVHPGYFFDFEREAYLVLSLLPPNKLFIRAATRLFDAIV